MADTTFVNGVTKIPTAWLNEVNNLVHTVFNNPTTDKINLAANGDLTIGPIASPALFLDVSAKKAGLGTNTPDTNLHVWNGSAGSVSALAGTLVTIENNGEAYLNFLTPNTATQQILFGDPEDNNAGAIIYSHLSRYLQFNVEGISAFKIDSNQDVTIGTTCALFDVSANNLSVGRNLTTESASIQVGVGRTGNGFSSLELIGDPTYTDYGLVVRRNNGGANTGSDILHRGTGALTLQTTDAGSILLKTNSTTALTVDASQDIAIGTTCAFFDVSANTLQLGKGLSTQTATLEIGAGRTGNGASGIVLVGDATYSSYGAALTRLGTGPNTDTILRHSGTGALRLQAEDFGSIEFLVNAFTALIVDAAQNIKIGTTATMGTSATKTLGIDIGVEPTTSPAGMIQVYAKDSSDGTTNATLAFRTEQAVEAIGTFTPSHKHKIWLNGVEYWIQLDAV